MGRKKRSAVVQDHTASAAHFPPAPVAFDPYGRPLPPLPPAPHYPPQQHLHAGATSGPAAKRARTPTNGEGGGEGDEGARQSYPAKKYRPDSYYRSIEAFSRYTKAHRMSADYVRWGRPDGTGVPPGATPEKPVVFGIRIAGSLLSWGRGKTRDAAIDAAIRAAFALVAAHGYDDFALNDDCFTEEPRAPAAVAPIPPPPPLPPPGMFGGPPPGLPPPLPPGLPPPPLPHGMPPPPVGGFAAPPPPLPPGGVPPSFALPEESMIPQPSLPNAQLAVASTVVEGGVSTTAKIMGLTPAVNAAAAKVSSQDAAATSKKHGSGLLFAGEAVDEEGQDVCMEEVRMKVPRYWTSIVRALTKTSE